jgi:3-oxoadipate enol-lactonase
MPTVNANGIAMYYETQGQGEPLLLIPYLSADQACYAFQVADYAQRYQCITVDLRGAGQSDKPDGQYSTELFADDIAAFMQAIGVERAHVSGLSLGAATGMWLAVKYPERVKTLSLHSAWAKSDAFLRTVVEGWRMMASGFGSVPATVITGIFPWCFTSEFYSAKPEYMASLGDFVRSRPEQPLCAFLQQTAAVQAHDVDSHLDKIECPTLITFGRYDALTPERSAEALHARIKHAEVVSFDDCAHAPIYQNVAAFNERTLGFLAQHTG